MIYCLKCGKSIPEGSKFCTFCGAPTPVIDPKQPNVASASSRHPVDVGTVETKTKTYNDFYKDPGFYGALLAIAGFLLPFYSQSGLSLYEAVSENANSDPWVFMWVIFPVTGLVVLLHCLVPGWPGLITTIFIILSLIAFILFSYVIFRDTEKYFGTSDFGAIAGAIGYGFWLTIAGTLLMLFHRRHKRVVIQKTKIIDRTI